MKNTFIAKSTITIHAPVSKVWEALINPDLIKQYLFGTQAISDWKVGTSPNFLLKGNPTVTTSENIYRMPSSDERDVSLMLDNSPVLSRRLCNERCSLCHESPPCHYPIRMDVALNTKFMMLTASSTQILNFRKM